MQFGAKVRYFLLSRNLLLHKSLEPSPPGFYFGFSDGGGFFRFPGVLLLRRDVAFPSSLRAVVFEHAVCLIYIMVKMSADSLPLSFAVPLRGLCLAHISTVVSVF